MLCNRGRGVCEWRRNEWDFCMHTELYLSFQDISRYVLCRSEEDILDRIYISVVHCTVPQMGLGLFAYFWDRGSLAHSKPALQKLYSMRASYVPITRWRHALFLFPTPDTLEKSADLSWNNIPNLMGIFCFGCCWNLKRNVITDTPRERDRAKWPCTSFRTSTKEFGSQKETECLSILQRKISLQSYRVSFR